jgi:cell division protein FtsX
MPVPAVALIALATVVLAVWAVRKDVLTRRRKAELLSTMGFRPLERPDP